MYRGDVITQAAFFKHLKEEKKQFKDFKQKEGGKLNEQKHATV